MTPRSVLSGVVSDADRELICPIRYLHNPLYSTTPYLNRAHDAFPTGRADDSSFKKSFFTVLSPLNETIPYCSSISTVYESRFWRETMEAARTFIHLLATDASSSDIPIRGSVTLREIARRELQPGFKHRTLRASAYMYPFCVSARRLEIIAIFMTMMFLFDDKCEVADEKQVPELVSDFFHRLEDPEAMIETNGPVSPLQAYLDVVIKDIRTADAEAGNGGAEVYREMRNALTSLRPTEPLDSIGAYLSFRRKNVNAAWVFASVKFSLASSVDIHQPVIRRFLEWAADHLSITNDLYSYEKEAKAYYNGTCPDLINIVAIVENLLTLPESSALEMVYALLLQREQWMYRELEMFEATNCLDDETWRFVRGVWVCLAGNTFFSMTCSRYGGEKARIPRDWKIISQSRGSAM